MNVMQVEASHSSHSSPLVSLPCWTLLTLTLTLTLNWLGRIANAVRLFDQALQVHPWSYMAYNNLACTYGQVGQTELGFRAFEHAIEIKPDYAKVERGFPDTLMLTSALTERPTPTMVPC